MGEATETAQHCAGRDEALAGRPAFYRLRKGLANVCVPRQRPRGKMPGMVQMPSRPLRSAVLPVGNGTAFFVSEWPRDDFADLHDFGVFYFRYSSAMQPLIQGWSDDEVQAWMVVDPDADVRYAALAGAEKLQNGDPVPTLESLLGRFLPNWVVHGKWHEFIVAQSDASFDLIGNGPQSFLSVFLAEELPGD